MYLIPQKVPGSGLNEQLGSSRPGIFSTSAEPHLTRMRVCETRSILSSKAKYATLAISQTLKN
jgi:hypothetical protein